MDICQNEKPEKVYEDDVCPSFA